MLIAIVLKLVQLILIPFDLAIATFLPELSDGLNAIGDYLVLITQSLGWAISLTGIPFFAIALVATAMIFRLTVPFNVWFIKLALGWYHTLKP